MTLARSVFLVCDGWKRGARCFATTEYHVTSAPLCRARAKAAGWVRRDGLDLCPACAAEIPAVRS